MFGEGNFMQQEINLHNGCFGKMTNERYELTFLPLLICVYAVIYVCKSDHLCFAEVFCAMYMISWVAIFALF